MTTQDPKPARSEKPLRNPFSNEGDAFRLLVTVLVSCLAVALIAALVSSTVALVLAGVLLAVATVRIGIWMRRWLAAPDRDSDDS